MSNFQKARAKLNETAVLLDIEKVREKVQNIREKGYPEALSTGWQTLDRFFKFPPFGQLNLVTGTPGSGKSELMDSLCLQMARLHGCKTFIYSPENFPAEFHLQKLCEKLADKPFFGEYWNMESMSRDETDRGIDFLKEHFVFTDCHITNSTVDQILNTIFIECLEKKVDIAVIDPWNKLENQKPAGISTTEFIGRALTRIQMFSREHGIWFFIVAHPAKPKKLQNGSYATVTLYDVSESAHWYNMIDNGFIVHRSWEDKIGYDNLATLKIAKIKDRRYGKCGEIELKFYPATGRYEAVDFGNRGHVVSDTGKW